MSQVPVEARKKKTPSSAADVAPLPGVNDTSSSNLSFFGLGRAIANRKYSIAVAAVFLVAGVFTGGGALVLGAVLAGGILLGPPAFRALGSLYSSRKEKLAREAMSVEPKKEPARSEKMNKASRWGVTTTLGVGLGIGAALAFGVLTGGAGFLVMGAIAGGVAGTVLAARAIQVSLAKRQERLSIEKITSSPGQTSNPEKEKSGVRAELVEGQKESRSAVMNKASKWGATTILGVGLGIGAALAFGVLTGGAGFLVMGAIAGAVAGSVLAARAAHVSLIRMQDVSKAVDADSLPTSGKETLTTPEQSDAQQVRKEGLAAGGAYVKQHLENGGKLDSLRIPIDAMKDKSKDYKDGYEQGYNKALLEACKTEAVASKSRAVGSSAPRISGTEVIGAYPDVANHVATSTNASSLPRSTVDPTSLRR